MGLLGFSRAHGEQSCVLKNLELLFYFYKCHRSLEEWRGEGDLGCFETLCRVFGKGEKPTNWTVHLYMNTDRAGKLQLHTRWMVLLMKNFLNINEFLGMSKDLVILSETTHDLQVRLITTPVEDVFPVELKLHGKVTLFNAESCYQILMLDDSWFPIKSISFLLGNVLTISYYTVINTKQFYSILIMAPFTAVY